MSFDLTAYTHEYKELQGSQKILKSGRNFFYFDTAYENILHVILL